MEKKHDLAFCAECGVKLDGDEMICPVCGYKLAELHPIALKEQVVVPPPPPVQEKPVVPPPPPVTIKPALVCPNCKAKIEEHEIFCNSCGTRLTMLQEQPPVVPPPPPVVPPPPPVAETPVVPLPPVVTEPVPPVKDMPPPVTETPAVVSFCPNCGTKIAGQEVFCNNCGTKITMDQKPFDTTPPPPAVVTPVTPPVVQQPVYQQQPVTPVSPGKKKGMGVFLLILIIFFGVLIVGGGTAALLQYTGTINVPFLAQFIPSKNTTTTDAKPVDYTKYYVAHSFASTGPNQWDAVVSTVIIAKKQYNNKDGAIVQYKKAVMKKFPKDYNLFTTGILCEEYDNLPAAQSGRSSLLKNYNKKRYRVRSVDVMY